MEMRFFNALMDVLKRIATALESLAASHTVAPRSSKDNTGPR